MKVAGGCYCGEIRFEAEGALEAAFQCHCRECQYITGGNPNIVMVFAQRDFRIFRATRQSSPAQIYQRRSSDISVKIAALP